MKETPRETPTSFTPLTTAAPHPTESSKEKDQPNQITPQKALRVLSIP